jgi:penicillin-binding protein 2B
MVQVALKMLGQDYTPDMRVNTGNRVKTYDAFRSANKQYGLGTSTGIDIPGESLGQVPPTSSENADVANLLFESFGQFDTFTTLQLAQYAQTIANNGVRLAPHIVEGIYSSSDSSLGKEVTAVQPKVMDKVNISQDLMDVIHLGMKEVVYGDSGNITGRYIGNGALTEIYAKTGTSESVAPDGTTGLTVHNVIGYAPGPNPQIAIGIMVPDISSEDPASANVNQIILNQIVNKAVEMKVIK